MITIQYLFTHCRVVFYPPDYMETVFDDSHRCPALFTGSDENVARAESLGYGRDFNAIRQMHFEHDISHSHLAEAMGLPYSPVLAHVAGVRECPDYEREREEGRVLAFQRFLNDGTRDELLDTVPDLDAVAERFKERFRRA